MNRLIIHEQNGSDANTKSAGLQSHSFSPFFSTLRILLLFFPLFVVEPWELPQIGCRKKKKKSTPCFVSLTKLCFSRVKWYFSLKGFVFQQMSADLKYPQNIGDYYIKAPL